MATMHDSLMPTDRAPSVELGPLDGVRGVCAMIIVVGHFLTVGPARMDR
jgi:hypothetical protein